MDSGRIERHESGETRLAMQRFDQEQLAIIEAAASALSDTIDLIAAISELED
jgi:hypothetical protein